MNFGTPKAFWLMLAVLPLLGFFLWWAWRKRQEAISQFVQNRFLAELTLGVAAGVQKARRIVLFFAITLLLLALARPQWGFTWEEATIRGRDIIVAIDTSRSMLAQDLQPNRLARAKLAALDLLNLTKFDRLGLVAFSGTAFLQCPLTLDDEAFRQSVEILQPGIIPQGGSALAEAIATAHRSFDKDEGENHRVIVLFTDGEDHEEGVLEQARMAAADEVRIFTIGVGTASGELIRVPDASGRTEFLKDNMGNAVRSRLNETLLQQIATAGDGFYLPLQGGNPMQVLYEKGLEPLPTSERSSKLMKNMKEQYYWPLGFAILLLLLEVFLPDRKRAVVRPAAATALLLLLLTPSTQGSSASALRKYQSGDYRQALDEYQRLLEKNPGDPRLLYNAGAAAYQAREYDYALSQFQAAAASPDLDIQQHSFYNMGNSLVRVGEQANDPQEKMLSWQQAVAAYEAALKLQPDDPDARFNLELVKKRIEELQKQQQQQKQNEDSQDKQDQEQEQQQQDNQQDQQSKENQQQQNNSENKDQQQEESSPENQQQQENQQQNEQEQQQPRPGEEKDQSEQQRAGSGDKPSETGEDTEAAQEGEMAQLGQMTPAQARQLLDAQKGEEKALLFIPDAKKASRSQRVTKDW